MLSITLPSILPVIQIVLIFAVADIVDVSFEKVFLMYHPGIYETADVIQTYVYRRGIGRAWTSVTARRSVCSTAPSR